MSRTATLLVLGILMPALVGASPFEHELRLLERDAAHVVALLREQPQRGAALAGALHADLRARFVSIETRAPLPENAAAAEQLPRVSGLLERIEAARASPAAAESPNAWTSGSVSGRVLAEATSLPIAGARVSVLTLSGQLVRNALTGPDGFYRVFRVPTGTYRVAARTEEPTHFIGAEYAQTVAVDWSGDVSGIDFALALGGQISGGAVLEADGSPASGEVLVYGSDGALASIVPIGPDGRYLTVGLPAGTYFAVAHSFAGAWSDQLFDGIDCTTCSPLSGTPIAVGAGATAAGVEFALRHHGRIAGSVVESSALVPIRLATAMTYDSAGDLHQTSFTDPDGVYTVSPEVPGTYFVRATAAAALYRGELFEEISCEPDCVVTEGSAVVTAPGIDRTGVDFTLDNAAGRVRGVVTDADSGLPLQGIYVDVSNSAGATDAWMFTDEGGEFSLAIPSAGTYFLTAGPLMVPRKYFMERYGGLHCSPTCAPGSGTPVPIAPGPTVEGIDFALDPTGSVQGRVTDAVTGEGVPQISIRLQIPGSSPRATISNADGRWTVLGFENDVTAFAWADPFPGTGYLPQIFDGIPCSGPCDPTSGTPISVTAGAAAEGIDFALTPGGNITGTVRDGSFGVDAPATLRLYDAQGVGLSTHTASGPYSIGPLFAGTYYLKAESGAHIDELFDGIPCEEGCSPADGTPITVAPASGAPGIDFDLEPLVGSIEGRITDFQGEPLDGMTIEFYSAGGSRVGSVRSGADGRYRDETFALFPGGYYVKASGGTYVPTLYGGYRCALPCPPAAGAPVTVNAGEVTTGIDIMLSHVGIGRIRQASGSSAGGETVVISGLGFDHMTSVRFGGIPGTVTRAHYTEMSVVTPAREPGVVDVEVVNGFGESAMLVAAFRFEDPRRRAPELVSDVNATPVGGEAWGIFDLTPVGDRFYFVRGDAEHGQELWTAPGLTTQGEEERVVADLTPGPQSTGLDLLGDLGGALVFVKSPAFQIDDYFPHAVWRSDGTEEGTFQLAGCGNFRPPGIPTILTKRFLFFPCFREDTGFEFWRTDGTVDGTILLRDIHPGPGSSFPPFEAAELNGNVYITAFSPASGYEVWRSDGTPDGTDLAFELIPGEDFAGITEIASAGGKLYLRAYNSVWDAALFISDGTPGGTTRLHVFTDDFSLADLMTYGNHAYFRARNALWRTDGTPGGTVPVVSMGAAPWELTVAGGYLFFQVASSSGYELWRTDGTAEGTLRLSTNLAPSTLAAQGPWLLFGVGSFPWQDHALWRTDGSVEGTVQVTGADHPLGFGELQAHDGVTLLVGSGPERPEEIWTTDGTETGTVQISRPPGSGETESSHPGRLTRVGSNLFFTAWNGADEGIYVSDGTPAGTQLLRPIIGADHFTASNGLLLFTAPTSGEKRLLWRSDGTIAGTRIVTPELRLSAVGEGPMTSSGGLAYFSADAEGLGAALLRTDGSNEGTFAVAPFKADSMADLDGTLFFIRKTGVPGLYRTDGTEETTHLVRQFSSVAFLAQAGGRLFLGADGAVWASDGTAGGTVPILFTQISEWNPPEWAVLDGSIYFTHSTGADRGLYVTDGTAAGTIVVVPFDLAFDWTSMTAANGVLFFAQTGVAGLRLGRTDGTPEGTEVFPGVRLRGTGGAGTSTAPDTVNANGLLYFLGVDGIHGFDLWRSDGTAGGTYLYWDYPHDPLGAVDVIEQVGSLLFFPAGGAEGVEVHALDVGPPVSVSSIAPASSPHTGGTAVTITGANLTLGVDTRFGQVPLQGPTYVSATSITGFTPELKPGRLYEVTVHNGESHTLPRAFLSDFLDVAQAHPLHGAVESIFRAGITAGCGGGAYCPDAAITRGQMAVFLLRGAHGGAYVPPAASGTMFADVPASLGTAAWIEQLAREGISAGCGGGNFCPSAPVTRAQMAVFLLRMKHGASYGPPPETGLFADVPPGSFAAAWIEQLHREGITGGCSADPMLFCPGAEATRGQMAVFVKKALGLP